MGPSCKRKTSRKATMCNNDNQVKKREEGTAAKVTAPPPAAATTPGSPPKPDSPSKIGVDELNGCCTTPKAKKNRMPEIKTCPPAPKKRRILSNFALKRSPISFFVPPELELFFLVPHRNVSF